MSFAKRLTALKKNWKESKAVKGSGNDPLPEGKYQFHIDKAVLEESKAKFNKGNMQVTYHLSVITGSMKGKKHWLRVDLESDGKKGEYPTGMEIFKGHLETLEIDMPKVLTEAALKKTLTELLGVIFNGACVHNNKGWANVYINDLVDASDEEDDEETEEVEEDEDEDDEEEDEEDEDEDFEVKKSTAKKPAKKTSKKAPAKKKNQPDPEDPEDEEDDEDEDDEDWDDDDDDDE